MTFDWFRRRFDQQTEEAQAAETKQTEPEASAADEQKKDTTARAAEDYLNWAKAAYQNIQKRQQTPATTQTESPTAAAIAPPSSPTPVEAKTEPVPQETIPPQPVTEAPVEAAHPLSSAEPVSTSTESGVVAEAPIAPRQEAPSGETGGVAPEPPVPVAGPPQETVAATPPLPFWVESEAERQARLERLKETAIAEPEPETVPSATVTTPTEPPPEIESVPDLLLDEGFLWSAEVLASQGRRPDQVSIEEITWLKRLRQGLDKTRRGLVNQLRAIVGQGPLNQSAVMEIEAALLQADVGVEATDAIIDALQKKVRDEILPPDAALSYLKQILRDMLDAPLGEANYLFAPQKDTLNIWLITGVNGAGKTTTIGKLAHIAKKSGYNCLIAAADTFRAAAVEQVKVWGKRSEVEVIANPGQNTDPAAVVFDAITAAKSRGTELLLVDTAGRLQNKKNLMDELSKIRRIIDKKAENAVVESLLVLDATLGQNGLRQAEVFSKVAQLSGVVLTKLDGTAKGGIALAVVQQLGLPIRFIGAGEGIEDLRPFSSYEFVEALLSG
ncbi:MAG: signal recognition particle-docking protein FtsY [Leptolyngbyaceae cyanobacterium HOT.MB2.61]|jgi:fused signal recognition particle receptor|nr:signal recognition particle-docking protein FtsY [Leptolyngbyaceae cyanobacterium HOT.MB2.61]